MLEACFVDCSNRHYFLTLFEHFREIELESTLEGFELNLMSKCVHLRSKGEWTYWVDKGWVGVVLEDCFPHFLEFFLERLSCWALTHCLEDSWVGQVVENNGDSLNRVDEKELSDCQCSLCLQGYVRLTYSLRYWVLASSEKNGEHFDELLLEVKRRRHPDFPDNSLECLEWEWSYQRTKWNL